MPISATIITLNEGDNIADCLAGLDFVDEIIVLDSGSSDQTEDLCRVHPKVRLYHQEWLGYGRQKNRAAELAQHDLILNVDADERVSPLLRRSIEQFDSSSFAAARMARENYFGRRWIRHCGWYPDYSTRLYDRRRCSFSERAVHESLQTTGAVATLAGNLVHYTYNGVGDYLERMNRYSRLAAEEYHRAGKTAGLFSMLVKPVATFIKMYLLRRGFLDGRSGLVLSLLYAVYTFCKYAKLSELNAEENRK
ncbi:glycosyltransferase family 2 protein [Trichlorobacter lovleyi]|uniref:glycosyltransferase family 2 protein n=1 Tax=Trichlorobacter lovleyi TaxID=313985 RepID=UPI00223F53A3|nr:glycosyltransferase family 2 protein [Trichlorobacter lovleyi]QOX78001.1 glycosyltransferase family 2 protein [Trichlorobacter lovleyi]